MNNFGISQKTFELLVFTFSNHPEIEEVLIFGSRAKGNFRKGSDIDLAIKGQHATPELAYDLAGQINEELPIPYQVEIVDYNSLIHTELKDHINRVGVVFYKKKEDKK